MIGTSAINGCAPRSWNGIRPKARGLFRDSNRADRAGVDAAFHLATPAPASGARIFARQDAACARHTSNGGKAVLFQRMRRKIKAAKALYDLATAKAGERIEL